MSEERPTRKTYSEAMNEWAAREGRASFADRSRVSVMLPDPFAHPMMRLLGYGWRLGLLVLLGAGGYWFLLRSHLAGEAFAGQLAGHLRDTLGAETASLSRLEWEGTEAHARRFAATGGPGSFFRTLEATQVSFRVPVSLYRKPEWTLSRVEAGSLQVDFRSGGLNVPEAASEVAVPDGFSPPLLTVPGAEVKLDAGAPDPELAPEAKDRDPRVLDLDVNRDGLKVAPPVRRVALGGVQAAHFGAGWGTSALTRGELREASIRATREPGGSWLIDIPGGTLSQNWLRGLKFTHLRARYDGGVLALENTPVQIREVTGILGGRIRCAEVPVFELTLQAEELPLETFCGDPFERYFNLRAGGTLQIGGSINRSTGITVTGAMDVSGGLIRGLAIQQALAAATTRLRFREFEITGGTVEFATGAGKLEVKSFNLLSRQDVVVRGAFTHDTGGFDGVLEIGVDPPLLQKLDPAVVGRFFPKSEEGKRWMTTPLKATGYSRLTAALAKEFTEAHEAAGRP